MPPLRVPSGAGGLGGGRTVGGHIMRQLCATPPAQSAALAAGRGGRMSAVASRGRAAAASSLIIFCARADCRWVWGMKLA